jgi:hypothetical protein
MKKIISTCVKKIPIINTLAYKYRDHLIDKEICSKRDLISALNSKVIPNSDPKNILFWSNGGMPDLTNIDATFALALQLRGHNVHVVICDGLYKACVKREIAQQESTEYWYTHCKSCKQSNTNMLRQFNVPFSYIGDWVTNEQIEAINQRLLNINYDSIDELEFEGVNIGPNIESSFLRYTKGVELREPVTIKDKDGQLLTQVEPDEKIMREYAFTAMINILAAKHCFNKIAVDKVFMSHGVYVEWGTVLKLALKNNIPVTGWFSSIVPRHFIFRNITSPLSINSLHVDDQTYEDIKSTDLTVIEKNQLHNYFKNRNNINLISPEPLSPGLKSEIYNRFNLEQGIPVWGVLSHINWDSVRDGTPMIYNSFNEWIIDTIKAIKDIKNVQWAIKIHPDELNYNASSMMTVIKQAFPSLPKHIAIIPPDSGISIKHFSGLIEGAVTVYSTLGLELALLGKPVIMAGHSHYARKGFTLDAYDKVQYHDLLRQVSNHTLLTDEQRELAYKYAHYFFIRRQIPVPILDNNDIKISKLNWEKIENLLPERDPFMDMICDRIIDNKAIDLNFELLKAKGL